MADKEQVEENGKGGDVVDGNSQGGKKGKKGETLEEMIQSSQYMILQARGERRKKEVERELSSSSSSARTSRRS